MIDTGVQVAVDELGGILKEGVGVGKAALSLGSFFVVDCSANELQVGVMEGNVLWSGIVASFGGEFEGGVLSTIECPGDFGVTCSGGRFKDADDEETGMATKPGDRMVEGTFCAPTS